MVIRRVEADQGLVWFGSDHLSHPFRLEGGLQRQVDQSTTTVDAWEMFWLNRRKRPFGEWLATIGIPARLILFMPLASSKSIARR